MHAKTLRIIEEAKAILAGYHPMTVRQVYYQLVAREVIENNMGRYKAVSRALVEARKDGSIPWDWIEDRLREPRTVSMWAGLADFTETAQRAYRRDVWTEQSCLIEVWLEKDALSGIFGDILRPYGVTLNVGRGYDGWSSIRDAALRYRRWGGEVIILYFGDFDPSGLDMIRSLGERLAFFETCPEIETCALLREDIERYHLPPAFTKKTDTRSEAFVAAHGDMAVELDALPIGVLQDRLRGEVSKRLDLDALERVRVQEARDRERLGDLFG